MALMPDVELQYGSADESNCACPPAVRQADPFGRFVLVSFYTPGGYYEECAKHLAQACERFQVEHDIVQITCGPKETWADICRRKIAFYKEMLCKHGCDIMWMDVDAELLRDPRPLHQGHFDLALFLRAFKYIDQISNLMLSRTFHPGYIVFRNTARTHAFLDDCLRIEQAHEGQFTDDYVLEEAFRTSPVRLRLMLLSPDDIENVNDAPKPDAFFRHGDSGNVKENIRKVRQHEMRLMHGQNQKQILTVAAAAAMAEGRPRDAIVFFQRIMAILPNDPDAHVRLLELLRKEGDIVGLEAEIARGLANPELTPLTLRVQFTRALLRGEWATAEHFAREIEATGHARTMDFVQGRLFRFSFDRRAKEAGIAKPDRPAIHWREEPFPGEVGELLNPYVLEKISGTIPRYAPPGEGLCAAGVIEGVAGAGTGVWGGGARQAHGKVSAQAIYHAVRGPLTRQLVERTGGVCPPIYGDSAALLPLVYAPQVERSHKTGFVFHHPEELSDLDISGEILQIPGRCAGADGIEGFVRAILDCERIVSTSLYGLVVAHAYGVPAAWGVCPADRRHLPGIFEFRDYFAAVGLDGGVEPYDVCRHGVHDAGLDDAMFRTPRHPIALAPLLEAAPFPVLPEILARARELDGQRRARDAASP